MVDTGATLSVIPASLLDRLRVRWEGTREFRSSDGHLPRDTGIVRLTYEGVTAGVSVVLGVEDDPVVMGETAPWSTWLPSRPSTRQAGQDGHAAVATRSSGDRLSRRMEIVQIRYTR